MRLADFITSNMERILARWEAFAASNVPAARNMSPLALRDNAQQILEAVVKDLQAWQACEGQTQTSIDLQSSPPKETAAQTHGILRAVSGFDINQMAGEYRALRASVMQLWLDELQNAPNVDDVIRFDAAIDQAIAESISFFSKKVDEARNLLLGMLAHDLRTPLQAIQMTAAYLAELNAGPDVSEAADALIRSGARMQALVNDLVEFNRTKLGLGIQIQPQPVDVADLFAEVLDQVRAAHPGHQLELEITGQTRGVWDGLCLQRLVDNLLVNALKYGSPDTPVRLWVRGGDDYLDFEVRNKGASIDSSTLNDLFDPLKRGLHVKQERGLSSGLGLGLHIAREIAKAHGGDIQARVDGDEACFSVRLPRHTGTGTGTGTGTVEG